MAYVFDTSFHRQLAAVTPVAAISRQITGQLAAVTPVAAISRQITGQLAAVTPMVMLSRQLIPAMEQIVSPVWEQVVFKVLHELDVGEADSLQVATRWQKLPLQVRTWVFASVVWTCLLTYLMALSLQHQVEVTALRNATGLDPAELAAAAACLAGMIYRYFARTDDVS